MVIVGLDDVSLPFAAPVLPPATLLSFLVLFLVVGGVAVEFEAPEEEDAAAEVDAEANRLPPALEDDPLIPNLPRFMMLAGVTGTSGCCC